MPISKNLPVGSKFDSPVGLNWPAWRMLDLQDVLRPPVWKGEGLPNPSAQRTLPAVAPLSPETNQTFDLTFLIFLTLSILLSHLPKTIATQNLQVSCRMRDLPHTPVMFAQSASSSLVSRCSSPIPYAEKSSCVYSAIAFLCLHRPAIGPPHHVSGDNRTNHILRANNTNNLWKLHQTYLTIMNDVLLYSPHRQSWPVEQANLDWKLPVAQLRGYAGCDWWVHSLTPPLSHTGGSESQHMTGDWLFQP